MFDYLQQFNNLPTNLRNQVSSSSAMATLMELERKYKVDLAMTVMKIMIKNLAVKDLPNYFVSEFNLTSDQAEKLSQEVKEKILLPVADYLGLDKEKRALDLDKDINILIQEASLVLPSETLASRLKGILATYLKGVRNRIDTRATLAKDINSGGLNLSQPEIERVFKVCDNQKFKSLDVNLLPITPPPATRLDKIINQAEKVQAPIAEYNFKQALAAGQIVKPAKLDVDHELPAPDPELDLPAPKKTLNLPQAKDTSSKIPTSFVPPTPLVAPTPVVSSAHPSAPPVVSKIQVEKSTKKEGLWNKLFSTKVSQETKTSAPKKVISPLTPSVKKTAPTSVSSKPITPKTISAARPLVSSTRPKIQDIKPIPKVMGPIEELQFLDLVNFRRLGKTPAEITAKIFSKIKLLERDGYDKMVAGVKAWRQSPVNRLYIKTGQDTLIKGVSLKDLVAARQKDDPSSLNLSEIEAIVSLNSKLVF